MYITILKIKAPGGGDFFFFYNKLIYNTNNSILDISQSQLGQTEGYYRKTKDTVMLQGMDHVITFGIRKRKKKLKKKQTKTDIFTMILSRYTLLTCLQWLILI